MLKRSGEGLNNKIPFIEEGAFANYWTVLMHQITKVNKFDKREHLDGLRGVAVIQVVLFHSGAQFFVNGYAGVDIFFVLSGYLITSLLIREIYNTKKINYLKLILLVLFLLHQLSHLIHQWVIISQHGLLELQLP